LNTILFSIFFYKNNNNNKAVIIFSDKHTKKN